MTTATMISFTCTGCGRPFAVPQTFAGRRATCKTCGASVTVPHPQKASPTRASATPQAYSPADSSAASTSPPPKPSMRQRRLAADAAQVAAALAHTQHVKATPTAGDPPETYRIEYRIRGLERDNNGDPIIRDLHVVEIQLTSDYPRLAPKCRMLTPIFHPNIDPATICVGDHWTAGERLVDLIGRIGEMICYQAYNIKSPLDAEAAMWADLHTSELPLDPRNMRLGEK
ncbi:MAG TPA: ubiquitin-conjugating enzyme E2 [Tepidisphaeraceae bacterium]|jgi:ubiquitin-protein ligase/DNA-directed RNA polymerase subunit RPC12/RpoP|nr:ubiquitin-conjugating enzyme E2 [Tepidisphaeraceae bacterium]